MQLQPKSIDITLQKQHFYYPILLRLINTLFILLV